MKSTARQHRGQALVLIVLAIVGMIGLTGLAIDGGNAYSDRRHAQNAADTAALAAALKKVRGGTEAQWTQAALDIASANGYNGASNPRVTVNVYPCTNTAHTPLCVLGAGEDADNVVQVVISSTIHTYFAPVLGIRQITNQVQAIAKAIPSEAVPWYDGNALVALMPGCKSSSWNHDPFDFAGSETTFVAGTGVFVNSDCNPAFIDNGSGNSMNVPAGVCVVGGVDPGANGITPAPQPNCQGQIDLSAYQLPPLDGG